MNKLYPATRWLFRIKGYFNSLLPLLIISYFIFIKLAFFQNTNYLSGYLLYLILPVIALILIVGEIYARLAYMNWGYEFTNHELKIERGIIWKKYSNIPYERIQNIDITRGIIARIFGFSSVNLQTAGYSGYSKYGGFVSEGYIPGVSKESAEKIREFVISHISKERRHNLQGL